MPVRCEKNGEGKDVYRYRTLSREAAFSVFERLAGIFDKYLALHGVRREDVYVNQPLLLEIITRVDLHKEYFLIFHKETRINEIKEAALFAYWVIRRSPFALLNRNQERMGRLSIETEAGLRNLNEGFAAFVILGAVRQYCKKMGCPSFCVSPEYLHRLMYALLHWDLSKEAMMLIAETLAESTRGEGKGL